MRLLVIEDEPDLAGTLEKWFREDDYAVDVALDGEDGLFKASEISYDAIILDLMLPRIDGWSVLQSLRRAGHMTPVLVLTARDEVGDRVRGLDLGADEYLTKPFALNELVARVRALIRRASGAPAPTLAIGDVTIETVAKLVHRAGARVDLTAREYQILELLARRRGMLVTRSAICEHVYNEDTEVLSNVVDVHVASLRRKLGANVIRTRRGHGYIVDA